MSTRRKQRFDGICPVCGKTPREPDRNYCRPCKNRYQNSRRIKQPRTREFLSPRIVQVLDLMLVHRHCAEIGRLLGIDHATVGMHLARARRIAGVANNFALGAWWQRYKDEKAQVPIPLANDTGEQRSSPQVATSLSNGTGANPTTGQPT